MDPISEEGTLDSTSLPTRPTPSLAPKAPGYSLGALKRAAAKPPTGPVKAIHDSKKDQQDPLAGAPTPEEIDAPKPAPVDKPTKVVKKEASEESKDEESEKKVVQIYKFKMNELVAFKAPAHSRLPREGQGCIMKEPQQGFFDVMFTSDPHMPIFRRVPHNYLRPANILINGSVVETRTLQKVLETDLYEMPMYQRRYTWGKAQWEALFEDAHKTNHYLGRMTLYEEDTSRMVVCDGQQRLTTTTLMIAAARDLALQLDDKALAQRLNPLIVPDKKGFMQWREKKEPIKDAEFLPFFRVIPTMADRKTYFNALLYPTTKETKPTLITRAKSYFYNRLKRACPTATRLNTFMDSVLVNFRLLHFQIEDDGSNSHTYENLAKREAGLMKMCHCPRPGVAMSPADLIRNLCIEYFTKVATAKKFLEQDWLPIEYQQPDFQHVEFLFASFLLKQDKSLVFKVKEDIANHFEKWIGDQLKDSDNVPESLAQIMRWILGHGTELEGREFESKGEAALFKWLVEE